jgi:hypothetical protein
VILARVESHAEIRERLAVESAPAGKVCDHQWPGATLTVINFPTSLHGRARPSLLSSTSPGSPSLRTDNSIAEREVVSEQHAACQLQIPFAHASTLSQRPAAFTCARDTLMIMRYAPFFLA